MRHAHHTPHHRTLISPHLPPLHPSNLLTNGSDAVERLMSSYGEIAELAGYTARVSDMVQVLQDMSGQGGAVPEGKTDPLTQMALGRYEVAEDALIEFKDVSIVTPNDDVLVEHLNFAMGRCQHVIIIGPNGCGKSSLFRILCGLWPLRAGVIRKPPNAKIFYIPQRPYLPRGTFRDQIIYPHTLSEMEGTDEDLEKLLEGSAPHGHEHAWALTHIHRHVIFVTRTTHSTNIDT